MKDTDQNPTSVRVRTGSESLFHGITPEIVAVIESAASSFLGRHVRIIAVALAGEPSARPSMWAAQGRDIIHRSRNGVRAVTDNAASRSNW